MVGPPGHAPCPRLRGRGIAAMGDSEDEFRPLCGGGRRRRRREDAPPPGLRGGPAAAAVLLRLGEAEAPPLAAGEASPEPPRDASSAGGPAPGPRNQICQEDLSALGGARREQHTSRCPDGREQRPGPAVPECPICGKGFGTLRSRSGHLKRCAARMEVPPALLVQAVRQQQQEARARGSRLPPAPGGLKRKDASSVAPSAKKPRKVAKTDCEVEALLVAMAMSRSLLEEEKAAAKTLTRSRQDCTSQGRKPPRAEKKSRVKPAHSPPPLLLQDPEKTRKEMEERVALLLSEVDDFPSTPPLSASHLALPKGTTLRTPSQAPLKGLMGTMLGTPGIDHSPEPSTFLPQSGPVRPLEMEHEPLEDSICGDLQGSTGEPKGKLACSQKDAKMLQDLVELACEGLTLTQWDTEVQKLQGAGQEPAPADVLQSRSVQSLEKKLPPRSCQREVPLGSLAAAFRGMVNNPHLSDVQFQVDSGEILYAHMFVLYARCPQLMEVVDCQGFRVAEEGGAETRRVLLSDAPEEAVHVFLNYLYTADHTVPQHVLSDVASLAKRYGVRELAALCGDQPGLVMSGGEEEDAAAAAAEEDRAETFEELLKSMWLDEDDALLKCAHQDNVSSSRDHVSEPELEEIYAFAATQRRAVPDGAEEARGGQESQQKEEGRQVVPGGACPRKGLEEPTAAVAIRKCKEEQVSEAPGDTSGEGALGRLPLGTQQDVEEMRSPRTTARRLATMDALLGLAKASGEEDPLELPESLASVTWEEAPKSPHAREPSISTACQGTTTRSPPSHLQQPPKDLQLALGTFSRDRRVPVLPLVDSSPVSSPQNSSHARFLLLSASQLLCTPGRLPSFQDSEQVHPGRRSGAPSSHLEKPICHPRPPQVNSDAAPIVLLDSDDEVELKQGVDPGLSGPQPGVSKCRLNTEANVSSSQVPSPPSHQGTGDPLLATLVCGEAGSPWGKSPQPWGLSSGEEGDSCGGGGMLLVPDTPLLGGPGMNSRLGAKPSLKPGPKEQWARASQATLHSTPSPFPEKPSLQSLFPTCDQPLLLPVAACSPSSSPSPLGADVVVVVDDSEEEQEATPPSPGGTSAPGKGLPAWEEAVDCSLPFAGLAGARSQLGTAQQVVGERTEGSSLTGEDAVASRVATRHFGEVDSSERTCRREWTDWTGEDSGDCSDGLPLTQKLPVETPDPACRVKDALSTTPLTPVPSYSIMETPKLKKELSRFGVRALPKRQMVLKLKEIFQYTHPKVGADCKVQAMPSQLPPPHSPIKTALRTVQLAVAPSTLQKQLPEFCQMFPGSPDINSLKDPSGGGDQGLRQMAEPCRSQAGSGQPNGITLSAARFPAGGGGGNSPPLPASQESTGSSVASSEASVTSQSSSSADFENSTLEEEEEEVPASQAAACEVQKLAALQHYLHSKPALYRQILLYQPIELAVLQAELKQNGIRIALGKLLDFLDALCITFTTAEARREKQQHRHRTKKKGRRRC